MTVPANYGTEYSIEFQSSEYTHVIRLNETQIPLKLRTV